MRIYWKKNKRKRRKIYIIRDLRKLRKNKCRNKKFLQNKCIKIIEKFKKLHKNIYKTLTEFLGMIMLYY